MEEAGPLGRPFPYGDQMTGRRATLTGFGAVVLWALLALFTVRTAPTPPFLLSALTFSIAAILGLGWTLTSGAWRDLRRVSLPAYAFGTAGLFGYHFLYFSALRLAPAAEASLIAYLWPLFIVLFSGLLPGERLVAAHIGGAVLALAGAALLIAPGMGGGLSASEMAGLGLAFLCALTWSGYSVGSRRLGQVPTAAVTVYCAATAILAAIAHLALEETALPAGMSGWAFILALGLGPVGMAFYLWDIGVKRGNIQMLGVASYASPLLSTLALVATGQVKATLTIAVSAALITAGAALAAAAGKISRRAQA